MKRPQKSFEQKRERYVGVRMESLAKLEKRFGVYRELPGNDREGAAVTAKISKPKPLDKSNDNADWKTYIAARSEYYRNQRQNQRNQRMTQRQEQRAMQDRHGKERKAPQKQVPVFHSTNSGFCRS